MDVSIIIVNWNSKDYLKVCIESIVKVPYGRKYEIIVVDNGSFDGCGEMLATAFPEVRFIQSEENEGFASANNRAFEVSKGRKLLFLNPDTEVKEGAVECLNNQLDCLDAAGIVGPKLLNSDGTVQTSCARVFPNIWNQVLGATAIMKLFPNSKLWYTTQLVTNTTKPREVDAVSGACLMIKREIFQEVCFFSEDYFMYTEDMDLCFKARQKGWKTYYVPGAVVVHHGGQSSATSPITGFSAVMLVESTWRFLKQNKSASYAKMFMFAIFVGGLFRMFCLLAMWPVARVGGRSQQVSVALRKWKHRLRWALGLERWAREY
jgi:N-acetylglucosaminyl-diphospho-decaprenol L-rhamnosyltransferase